VTFCGNLLYSQIKVFFLIFVVVDHWSVRLLHPRMICHTPTLRELVGYALGLP